MRGDGACARLPGERDPVSGDLVANRFREGEKDAGCAVAPTVPGGVVLSGNGPPDRVTSLNGYGSGTKRFEAFARGAEEGRVVCGGVQPEQHGDDAGSTMGKAVVCGAGKGAVRAGGPGPGTSPYLPLRGGKPGRELTPAVAYPQSQQPLPHFCGFTQVVRIASEGV